MKCVRAKASRAYTSCDTSSRRRRRHQHRRFCKMSETEFQKKRATRERETEKVNAKEKTLQMNGTIQMEFHALAHKHPPTNLRISNGKWIQWHKTFAFTQ